MGPETTTQQGCNVEKFEKAVAEICAQHKRKQPKNRPSVQVYVQLNAFEYSLRDVAEAREFLASRNPERVCVDVDPAQAIIVIRHPRTRRRARVQQ